LLLMADHAVEIRASALFSASASIRTISSSSPAAGNAPVAPAALDPADDGGMLREDVDQALFLEPHQASRIGVELTPNWVASRAATAAIPGGSSSAMIVLRSRSTPAARPAVRDPAFRGLAQGCRGRACRESIR